MSNSVHMYYGGGLIIGIQRLEVSVRVAVIRSTRILHPTCLGGVRVQGLGFWSLGFRGLGLKLWGLEPSQSWSPSESEISIG